MKITKVSLNNRKKMIRIETRKGTLEYPFAKLDIRPTAKHRIEEIFVDPDLGNEAVAYTLESVEVYVTMGIYTVRKFVPTSGLSRSSSASIRADHPLTPHPASPMSLHSFATRSLSPRHACSCPTSDPRNIGTAIHAA